MPIQELIDAINGDILLNLDTDTEEKNAEIVHKIKSGIYNKELNG